MFLVIQNAIKKLNQTKIKLLSNFKVPLIYLNYQGTDTLKYNTRGPAY